MTIEEFKRCVGDLFPTAEFSDGFILSAEVKSGNARIVIWQIYQKSFRIMLFLRRNGSNIESLQFESESDSITDAWRDVKTDFNTWVSGAQSSISDIKKVGE